MIFDIVAIVGIFTILVLIITSEIISQYEFYNLTAMWSVGE